MLPLHPCVPDVRRIAVLRANALGDFLFALPALEALHAAYPEAEIVLLARQWHADFLNDRPGPVDRVVVLPPIAGVSERPGAATGDDQAAQEEFFAAMRRERFDLALQMHGGGRSSNPVVLGLGARFTAGSRTPDAAVLDRWLPYVLYQPEIMRYLEIAALVGAPPVVLEPRLFVTQRDHAEANAALAEDRPPLVVLHPGAGDGRRQWSPECFAAVGDALAGAGYRVALTGTPPERPIVEQVLGAMRAEAHDLCDRLSLGGLAGLFARCALLVSNDTGPLHLAAAVGAPTVGIYWCGNQITYGHLTRARHRPLLSWRLDCPVCGRNCMRDTCDHQASFVADVPLDDVLAAAHELLSRA
ncbi:MAG: glycosyltransferase family 9 protein [Roseiflexaceae bacterium]